MWIPYVQETFTFWFLVAVLYASGAMYRPMREGLPAKLGEPLVDENKSKSASSTLLSAAT